MAFGDLLLAADRKFLGSESAAASDSSAGMSRAWRLGNVQEVPLVFSMPSHMLAARLGRPCPPAFALGAHTAA